MSDELRIAIEEPTYYKAHQNNVTAKWGVYETDPAIIDLDGYGNNITTLDIDGYGDFEVTGVLLNVGDNTITYTFDYSEIIDGYGKAHGLTYQEVIDSIILGDFTVDGYSLSYTQQVLYDRVSRVLLAIDGIYYKEIRRAIDGTDNIESKTSPAVNYTVDSNQEPVGFREEEITSTLSEATHALKIDAHANTGDGIGIDGYGIRIFDVDDTGPVISIITPVEFDPADLTTVGQTMPTLVYTLDGVENPPDIPLVDVRIDEDDGYQTFTPDTDLSDGYGDGYGFVDGYGRSRIPSGTVLNSLVPGSYKMRIVAQDDAGNMTSVFRRFSFNVPFEFSEAPTDIWIGSDLDGDNQSDSIMEELMIRNVEITDDEAELDYKFGLRDLKFRTKEDDRLVFTDAEETAVRQLAIDLLTAAGDLPSTLTSLERESRISVEIARLKSALNDRDRLLLLSQFDINIEPTEGAGELTKEFNPVVRDKQSLNELKITILQKPSEIIDKDLLRDLINKIKAVHTRVILVFEEVPDE